MTSYSAAASAARVARDRKSTRLNSSHTEIYTLSLHDALPISPVARGGGAQLCCAACLRRPSDDVVLRGRECSKGCARSEEHTSELQSHRDLHSFPTRRSSDLSGSSRRWRAALLRRLPSAAQ